LKQFLHLHSGKLRKIKPRNILILQTEMGSTKILGQYLSMLGHNIVWAKGLKKAQASFKKKKIHLVISNGDKTNQKELCEVLENVNKPKVVLIHSHRKRGRPSKKNEQYLEEIYGPFNISWLVSKMQKILASQRSV